MNECINLTKLQRVTEPVCFHVNPGNTISLHFPSQRLIFLSGNHGPQPDSNLNVACHCVFAAMKPRYMPSFTAADTRGRLYVSRTFSLERRIKKIEKYVRKL
jgi:hypothetical protein